MMFLYTATKTNATLSSDNKGSSLKAPPSTSEVQAQAKGKGPGLAGFPAQRASIQHPVWVLCQCPTLAEGAGLSRQQPQSQVPRPHPTFITEGAWCPEPSLVLFI